MAHLIDKSALVAEIERLKDELKASDSAAYVEAYIIGAEHTIKTISDVIDTLEVKDFWKPADGDDLPEIDREVVALLDNGKVVFAHRPPEYWDGKDIATGKVTRHYPKTYDKGGWNIPNVKYWLDCSIPKEIEL